MSDRTILGSELPSRTAALDFEGVSLRVFPLPANLHQLRSLCDRYGDLVAGRASLEPLAPFVLMMVVNYGKLSPAASSLGWVAQNEVVFSVPVVWRGPRPGEAPRWASLTPFIFVDNEYSTATGREVYGWPKVLGWFAPAVDRWVEDPRAPRRLLTLRTLMFSKLYSGRPLEPRVLLEVEHQAAQTPLQFPVDADNLLAPLLRWPAVGLEALARSWGGQAWAGPAEWLGRLPELAGEGGRLQIHTINLKQFLSPDQTWRDGERSLPAACYQALVSVPLRLESYRGSGLLGDVEQLRGDPSGGFTIRIHRNRSHPIVEALGLQAVDEDAGDETAVSLLRPVGPFWLAADLRYEDAETICWRAEGSAWCTGKKEDKPSGRRAPMPYLSLPGPLAQPIQGPFDFWDASVRILPLEADRSTLQAFVDARLGPASAAHASLQVLPEEGAGPPLVFLLVSTYGQMSAPANDLGWWARRQLAFAVPLLVTPSGETEGYPALYWPYVFNDSPLAVSTGREFTGLPSEYARLVPGRDPWLDAAGPVAGRRLMTLWTREFPALGAGQPAEERLLLEIVESQKTAYHPSTQLAMTELESGRGPLATLPEESLEALLTPFRVASVAAAAPVREDIEGLYFDNFLLKQYRDAADPRLACYQAIVVSRTIVGRWRGSERPQQLGQAWIPERPWQVRLHHYPSHPIASSLGLVVAERQAGDGAPVAVLQSGRSYWLRADLQHGRPQTVAWRAGEGDWHAVDGGRAFLERSTREDLGERDLDSLLQRIRRAVGGG